MLATTTFHAKKWVKKESDDNFKIRDAFSNLIIRFMFVKKYMYHTRRSVLVLHVVECICSRLQL